MNTTNPFAILSSDDPLHAFAFRGSKNIHDESHCGIVNGLLAPGIPYKKLGRIEGLWAPPYVSTDFRLDFTINGQDLPCWDSIWHPFQIERFSRAGGFEITNKTVLIPGRRAGLMRIRITNPSDTVRTIPIRCEVSGTLDREGSWYFLPPVSKTATDVEINQGTILLRQGEQAIVVQALSDALSWVSGSPSVGSRQETIAPGETKTIVLVFSIGPVMQAKKDVQAIAGNPENAITQAEENHRRQVQEIYARLPRLISDNPEFDRWYHRSLVHLILNRWEVPEFVTTPYYGTGSVRGGCICCYIWNYGELWEIMPLFEPAANRAHIIQSLKNDLTKCLAWNPLDGKGAGSWYQVNQEKIVGLIYFHLKNTGELDFLNHILDGRSILDHAIEQALVGDDLSKPVDLVDYGPANDHLELRRGILYNHVMPDLNARRYQTYQWVAELSALVGKPRPDLTQRANDLKRVIRDRLWNSKRNWFEFLTPQGRDIRWTNQMFKLFSSGVLDTEMEAGLLGHLCEGEFLSEYGLHSLAIQDVAYDPKDVDNGGPGSCTSFPPQIAERLYKAGHPNQAADLIRRTLWWQEKVPYWSDSMNADCMDYRHDTTLQCMVDGVAIAQSVIFGAFGIRAEFDGSISVNPQATGLAKRMKLQGVRLRGKIFDVQVSEDSFSITYQEKTLHGKIGTPLQFE